jgi:hypothetical protein
MADVHVRRDTARAGGGWDVAAHPAFWNYLEANGYINTKKNCYMESTIVERAEHQIFY